MPKQQHSHTACIYYWIDWQNWKRVSIRIVYFKIDVSALKHFWGNKLSKERKHKIHANKKYIDVFILHVAL